MSRRSTRDRSRQHEKTVQAEAFRDHELSRRKGLIFSVITLLFPLAFLILLELGLRAARYGGETPLFEAPEKLHGRYLVPGRRVAARYFPRAKSPPTPPVDAFLVKKPTHGMRIFVMGESAAAGFPYPANAALSNVVHDALQDVLPNDTIEVVNLGIAATNSYTIADLAPEVIAQHPDAILIYAGHNEYYGALGPLSGFDPKREQQHQIFPAIDLNVSPKWEFNFGVGVGLTRSTDHLIFKMIVGRRFTFGHKQAQPANPPD